MADPVGLGVESTSLSLQYDTNKFTFDAQASGFLCQSSSGGDCPPASAAAGTFPLTLFPASGFNPGPPLPGSTVALSDSGGIVTLDYQLSSPVDITQDTNFFLFLFDFKHPITVDLNASSITYYSSQPGLDFTQTNFVCHTNEIPDRGCGSADGIMGIDMNLTSTPEPASWSLLGL